MEPFGAIKLELHSMNIVQLQKVHKLRVSLQK